jgi:hypothetical protein
MRGTGGTWRLAAGFALLLAAAGSASAQQVPTEVTRAGGVEITLHIHPDLAEEDRALLRALSASPDALAALLGSDGFAAIALAPAEGMARGGVPAESAIAIGQLPDAAAARTAALEGCTTARRSGPACVVVLEMAPLR